MRFLSLFLALFLVLCPVVFAQEPDSSASDNEEVNPPEEPFQIPEALANARATMRTFLEAFDDTTRAHGMEPLEQAATSLDLSAIRPDIRQSKGQELASQLKEVLDRTVLIDYADLPDEPDANPWKLEIPDAGTVEIAPDDRGVWLFTTDTVDDIPLLFRLTEKRERIEGVAGSALTPAMWLRSQMPENLLEPRLGLEQWQWLGLLLLLVLGFLLDRVVTALVGASIRRYLKRRMESIDPVELRHALRPLGLLVAALVFWAGIFWLALPTDLLEILLVAAHFVAAVASVWAAWRMVDIASAVLEQRAVTTQNTFDDLLVPLFRKSMKILVVALGLIFLAETLSLPIGSLIAGLGVGGLALALAGQDVAKNLFGSLTVILDRPFSVGDWVTVGDIKGTVVELGFRSTRIRTPYDSIVSLPNSNLINASVDNYGLRRYRRWNTQLTLDYNTPPERIEAFCEGIRELIRKHPHTRKDSFEVHLNEFSASSLDVMLLIYFVVPDWSTELEAKHRLSIDILRLAADLGVDFAFPTQTLYLKRPEATGEPVPFEAYAERLEALHKDARERVQQMVE